MDLKRLGSGYARLRAAGRALSLHDLLQRREIAVGPAGELALVTVEHLLLEPDKRADIDEKARLKARHVDGVHPPQGRLHFERPMLRLIAGGSRKPACGLGE